MAALESFLHNKTANGAHLDPMPTLIKAAFAHLLHEGGALDEPLLYLSLYLKRHRSIYYERLDHVRSDGDWEGWVDFFLEGIEETAQGAVETPRRLVSLFQEDINRTQAEGRAAASAIRLLTALRERPVSSLGRLAEQSGMTFPTASKAMGRLVDLGIARELTGQRRSRVFVYDTYLGILSEGGRARLIEGLKERCTHPKSSPARTPHTFG